MKKRIVKLKQLSNQAAQWKEHRKKAGPWNCFKKKILRTNSDQMRKVFQQIKQIDEHVWFT